MAAEYDLIGDGTTITFLGDGGAFVAKVISLDGPSSSRDIVDTTNMTSVGTVDTANIYRDFVSGAIDMGEVSLTVAFDPEVNPPINGAKGSVVITWPNTAGSTWTFTGMVSSCAPGAAIGEHLTMDITIKLAGEGTFVATP